MSRFSPSDAALEGFRLTREQPLAVLIWARVRLLYGVLSLVILFGLGGSAFHQITALENNAAKLSPDAVMPLMVQIAPAGLLVVGLTLVFYAVIYTAVLRAILRPAERSFGYLRLSLDELRQFGLAVVLLVLFVVYSVVLEIVAILLFQAAKALGPAATLGQIVVILGVIAGFVYPVIRLSVAPAMTFADGKISVFKTLPVTKGQFWAMFGSYGLALILTVVVTLLAAVIFMFVIGAVGIAQGGLSALPAMLGAMQTNDMTLSGFLSPLRLANLVFSALLGTLAYLILFAPAAAIFRNLSGRAGAPVVQTKPGQPWG